MQLYHVLLFVHIVSLLIAAGAVATLHLADLEIRRTSSLAEAGRLALRMKKTAHAFPFAIVGLVVTGVWMTHRLGWGFSAPWILAGEVGLGAIIVLGDAVNGSYGKRLGSRIGAALGRGGDGPLPDDVLACLDDPVAKAAAVAPTGLMFGVVYVMSAKPGVTGSVLAMLIALLAGVVVSQPLLRRPAARAERAVAADTA
jgi:uncharacterized membrane protein